MTCGMLPWGVRGRAGVPWHLALQTPTTYALPSAPLTHALPPLVSKQDSKARMMQSGRQVGIEVALDARMISRRTTRIFPSGPQIKLRGLTL